MILSRNQYDAIAKGEPLVQRKISKLKNGGNDVKVTTASGELHERETFKARTSKCPHPVGTHRVMRYRDKPDDPIKGNLSIIVTEAEPDGAEHWIIRWERVTQHNPVPIQRGNVFLARGGNYTGSPDQSIDREAPVIETDHIRKLMADDLAGRREIQRKAGDHNAPGKLEDIDETADHLRDLLADTEEAA